MKASPKLATMFAQFTLALLACSMPNSAAAQQAPQKVVVTSPATRDVTVTEQYVCKIHAQRHVEIHSLASGYLEEITIKEGQTVKKGDVLFKILPVLYRAKLDAELAEVKIAQLELDGITRLKKGNVASPQEEALYQAKLAKAQAKAKLAEAELNFTAVKAPFDGRVDRLNKQQGSRIKEDDVLTTLTDNSRMWVYFNVPDARYLAYMSELGEPRNPEHAIEELNKLWNIELLLSNGKKFPQTGKIAAIAIEFNKESGGIAFRADFPNPDGLLRHGQTGNIVINKTVKNVIVIPQRSTFEILDKRFVYVVDKDNVARVRQIVVQNEVSDVFVIKKGLNVNEKIVLEGVRSVRDGEKVEAEFRKPEEVIPNLKKFYAE